MAHQQDWAFLIPGVEDCLAAAHRAFAGYPGAEDADDSLGVCLGQLRSVRELLARAECGGGALLAEEAAELVEALRQGAVSQPDDACEALRHVFRTMPSYLRETRSGRQDALATLIRMLNELRAARGEILASEMALFAPVRDILATAPAQPSRLAVDPGAQRELVKRLSQIYQYALLAVLKGDDAQKQGGNLVKVFIRLQELCRGTPEEQLWRVAAAFVEGVVHQAIPLRGAVRQLLWGLGRQLRHFAQQGPGRVAEAFPDSLFKNILFYVAVADLQLPRGKSVRETYRLADALPTGRSAGEGSLGLRYEPPVTAALSTAIVADLAVVEDGVKRYFAGESGGPLLATLKPGLRRAADALALTGQEPIRRMVLELAECLVETLAAEREIIRDGLAPIMARTAAIEAALRAWALACARDDQGSVSPTDAVADAVAASHAATMSPVAEARGALSLIRDALAAGVSSGDFSVLAGAPLLARGASHALARDGRARVADLIAACGDYVAKHVIREAEPPGRLVVDALAAALAQLDDYLALRDSDDAQSGEHYLDRAAESLRRRLGAGSEPEIALAPAGVVHGIAPTAGSVAAGHGPASEDEEFREIFLEEAREVVEALRQSYARWALDPNARDILTDIRRSFHTLKGSGRMVGATAIAALAAPVEDLLNKVLEGRVPATGSTVPLVEQVLAVLPDMIDDFGHRRDSPRQRFIKSLAVTAAALARGEAAAIPIPVPAEVSPPNTSAGASELFLTIRNPVDGGQDREIDKFGTEQSGNIKSTSGKRRVGAEDSDGRAENHDLLTIFCREADVHLAVIAAFIDEHKHSLPQTPTAELHRALHTLKGSAATADIWPLVEMLNPLEQLIKECSNCRRVVDGDLLELLGAAVQASRAVIIDLEHGGRGLSAEASACGARAEVLLARVLDDSGIVSGRVDVSALAALLTDGLASLIAAEDILADWRERSAGGDAAIAALITELSELNVAASRANLAPIAALGKALVDVYEGPLDSCREAGGEVFDMLAEGHRTLLGMIDAAAAEQVVQPASASLLVQLRGLSRFGSAPATSTPTAIAGEAREPESTEPIISPIDVGWDSAGAAPDVITAHTADPPPPTERARLARSEPLLPQEHIEDGVEPDILAFFLDEADELLELVEKDIHAWRDGADENSLDALKRALHTLKGGARMAGLRAFADATHDFEARVFAAEQDGGYPARELFQDLLDRHDQLLEAARQIRRSDAATASGIPIESRPEPQGAAMTLVAPRHQAGLTQPPAVSRMVEWGTNTMASTAKIAPPLEEMVKIPARMLDNLVDLAGEASISRGRVGRQLSEFNFSLLEMESTIARLQDQIRRLGMETEAQIVFRREQIESSEEATGFDPLELDRYSQLQQLTRASQESAADLLDIRETLLEKSRGAEALLIHQGGINSDLQESLMRTRMVPFSRLVPRLRRIVRQVGGELGKPVQLCLDRIDGDMDRAVLEKIVAPLEHMIRNSVDHGIEPPEQRRAAGKPEEGNLNLSFRRDGGDIIIHFRDDGRGLDLPAIRAQAIARELLRPEDSVSDRELMELIFRPGFSTSRQVSQVSGRGVGMDVVNQKVRELGGSIAIDSRRGVGTEFAIRLPFTLSMNRALLVRHNDHSYALPLNTIHGLVRVSGDELANYSSDPAARFAYGGNFYRVLSLSQLLNMNAKPPAGIGRASLVLVEGNQHHWAVQVDGLEGSLDIVAKSLGPQFSNVLGLSGVTTLGDGRVVVVLDLPGLLGGQALPSLAGQLETTHNPPNDDVGHMAQSPVTTILVVDDSVTVRKVTSRVLEREGFRVITAKDGIDAMRVLQDIAPDLMLLDVEMPRMDGFEVARQVRSSARLKALPIVMITSRTGDKHREKALAAGVNTYLGKPYQEEALLATIRTLLRHDAADA